MDTSHPVRAAGANDYCGLCGQRQAPGQSLFRLPPKRTGDHGPLVCWTCRWNPSDHQVDRAFLERKVRHRLAERPCYTPTIQEVLAFVELLEGIEVQSQAESELVIRLQEATVTRVCPTLGRQRMRCLLELLTRV